MKVKQIIALVVVVALLMAGSVLVTLAYLTTERQVTNVFTVGNITMTLDEAKVNEKGQIQYGENDVELREDRQNNYHLIPGWTYTKDPTVTILANSEPCYVRMMITLSHYEQLCAVYGDDFTLTDLIPEEEEGDYGFNDAEWELTDKGNGVYELRYKTLVTVGDSNQKLNPAFKEIKLTGDITNTQLDTLKDMKIEVKAHAMQSDGFNGNVDDAWAAFKVDPVTTTSTENTDEEPTATTDGN